jgi:hypothetical protein
MCVFRPIRYKDKGFCSKECYEASKIEIPEQITVGVEVPISQIIEVVTENEVSEEEILIEIESDEDEDDGIHE